MFAQLDAKSTYVLPTFGGLFQRRPQVLAVTSFSATSQTQKLVLENSGAVSYGFIMFQPCPPMSFRSVDIMSEKKWTTAQGSNPVSTEEYGSAYDCIDDHQIYIPGPEHPQLSCKLVMLGMLINFFMANVPQKHTKTRPLQKWRRIGGLFSTWFQICRRSCFSRPIFAFFAVFHCRSWKPDDFLKVDRDA